MADLIIYSSTDGQTKKICETIKSHFSSNNNFKIISLNEALKLNLENCKKIIIGASIRYGSHNRKVLDFVIKNKSILSSKKTAFFSVNVVARKEEKSTPETNPYVIKFLKKTKWKPSKLSVFAGKVDYPNYNFFNKNVIRLIMKITKGPTDINNSYEFTNWEKVRKFAKELENL
tara:strand:+ start:2104 stop:2625 length:522 start_codon:yes stop_codon:yes gene_type:complete